MKQFLFLVILLPFASVNAQMLYESPHVKDGKTIHITIPAGYHEIENEVEMGLCAYSSDKELDIEKDDVQALNGGTILVAHISTTGETLTSIKEDLKEKMEDDETTIVDETPHVINSHGRQSLHTAFRNKVYNDWYRTTYLSITEHGDYFLLITYSRTDFVDESMDFEMFKNIMFSLREVATEKKNQIRGNFDNVREEFETQIKSQIDEDYSIHFTNDLFETKLSYMDVLPKYSQGWDEAKDESGHLLSRYDFESGDGCLKIFSGGLASNYPSEEEMGSAIESAMDWTQSISLSPNGQFSNEDHFFQLYTILGGGTMSSVYTTIVADELIFFVVDGGQNPVDDFKPAVRDFMLTMWVDYFDPNEKE